MSKNQQIEKTRRRRAEAAVSAANTEIDTIAHALNLRCRGYAYSKIATEMGVDETHASKLVEEGLNLFFGERPEAVRKLELLRLDEILCGIYEKAICGDLQAMDCVLKISERRTQLEGFSATPKPDPAELQKEAQRRYDEEKRALESAMEKAVMLCAEQNALRTSQPRTDKVSNEGQ